MTLVPAARAALVTLAVAGSTLLGVQAAQADGAAGAGVNAPQTTATPTATTDTNPWD